MAQATHSNTINAFSFCKLQSANICYCEFPLQQHAYHAFVHNAIRQTWQWNKYRTKIPLDFAVISSVLFFLLVMFIYWRLVSCFFPCFRIINRKSHVSVRLLKGAMVFCAAAAAAFRILFSITAVSFSKVLDLEM